MSCGSLVARIQFQVNRKCSTTARAKNTNPLNSQRCTKANRVFTVFVYALCEVDDSTEYAFVKLNATTAFFSQNSAMIITCVRCSLINTDSIRDIDLVKKTVHCLVCFVCEHTYMHTYIILYQRKIKFPVNLCDMTLETSRHAARGTACHLLFCGEFVCWRIWDGAGVAGFIRAATNANAIRETCTRFDMYESTCAHDERMRI